MTEKLLTHLIKKVENVDAAFGLAEAKNGNGRKLVGDLDGPDGYRAGRGQGKHDGRIKVLQLRYNKNCSCCCFFLVLC